MTQSKLDAVAEKACETFYTAMPNSLGGKQYLANMPWSQVKGERRTRWRKVAKAVAKALEVEL